MSSSNLRYACGALAALILLVALPTMSHARRSPTSHDPSLNSGIVLNSDYTKSLKDNGLTDPRWITANISLTVPLARHAAAIVKTESGETLCAIAGGTAKEDHKEAHCYPLKVSGEPDISGGPAFSLTEALRYLAATVVDNHIYILGGEGKNELGRDQVYCVGRNTSGTWTVNGAGVMTQTIMQHAAVTVDDRIYVIGGYDPPHVLADVWSAKVVTDCVVFDTSSWRREAPLRTRDGKLYQVSGHAVASAILDDDKKFIYVIGGLDSSDTPANKVLRAKVGSDGIIGRWDDLGTVEGMSGTWLLTAVAVGRHLYVLGGDITPPGPTQISSDDVYSAEINDDDGSLKWDRSLPDLPIPLYAHATAVSKSGYLYVVGGISSNIAQQNIYFIQIPPPWLSFEKSSEPSRGPVTYGDTISYTLKLTSLGVRDFMSLTVTDTVRASTPVTLTLSSLTQGCDPHENTITCTIPYLAITETKEITCQVTISQPISADLQSQSLPGEMPLGHVSDLSLQINSEHPLVIAGQELAYTLAISNGGPSAASNVQVVDYLPDGVTFESATPPPSSTSPPTWSLDSIPAGEKREIRITVRVDSSRLGIMINRAIVSSSQPDAIPSNDQGQARTIAVGRADLSMSAASAADPMTGTLVYTLTVHNAGPSDARGVRVTDKLPEKASFLKASPSQADGPDLLTWNLDVPAGQSREIQITASIDPDNTDILCSQAEISSDVDPSPTNNTVSTCLALHCSADLIVTKSDYPDPVKAGEDLTYTLTITNAGPSEATSVVLTDSLPTGTTLITYTPTFSPTEGVGTLTWYIPTLEPDQSHKFEIVVRVDAGSSGTLLNKAEVTSAVLDTDLKNNVAEEMTAINEGADLGLEKSHSAEQVVIAGRTLTYTLVVSNGGPATASGVIVIDRLPSGTQFVTATHSGTEDTGFVTWHIPTLLPSQREELELEVQIGSGATGCLSNAATVASSTPDSNLRNNLGVDCNLVYTQADLDIEKHGDPGRVRGGDMLTYTLLVNNEGPSDALTVTVTDTLPNGVTFHSSVPPRSSGPNPLFWQINKLTLGQVWTITVIGTVNLCASGPLVNMACVRSSTADDDSSDDCHEERTYAPVPVVNTAYVCEDNLWCQASNTVVISQCDVYLPVILRAN